MHYSRTHLAIVHLSAIPSLLPSFPLSYFSKQHKTYAQGSVHILLFANETTDFHTGAEVQYFRYISTIPVGTSRHTLKRFKKWEIICAIAHF